MRHTENLSHSERCKYVIGGAPLLSILWKYVISWFNPTSAGFMLSGQEKLFSSVSGKKKSADEEGCVEHTCGPFHMLQGTLPLYLCGVSNLIIYLTRCYSNFHDSCKLLMIWNITIINMVISLDG